MEDESFGLICGGYTNEFHYIEGPPSDSRNPMEGFSFAQISQNEFIVEGAFSDKIWIG